MTTPADQGIAASKRDAARSRAAVKCADLLRRAAAIADEFELTLPNGAEVGNIAGGCANDLEQKHGIT